MARWFYDCEFLQTPRQTLDLVSIGVVSEDGRRSYYAVSTAFDERDALPWVRTHVLSHLTSPSDRAWKSPRTIREDLETLLCQDTDGAGAPVEAELWAWMGAYDHVVLCNLWGTMPELHPLMPRYTRDVRQLWEAKGSPL